MSNAIVLLQEQVKSAEALKQLPRYSPQYKIWRSTTTKILRENFTDEYAYLFNSIPSTSPRYSSPAERRKTFLKLLEEEVQFLEAAIQEYTRFQAEPSIDISRSSALNMYDFHKEIKAVSLRLYEDKHYPQAVEEAFKRVIKEVKRIVKEKTGQEYMKADDLMNRAFSAQNPVIQFNQLQTIEDKDEQQGIM